MIERGVTTVRYLEDGTAVLSVRGEHDLATRPRLEDVMCGLVEQSETVVVDFSGAEFIDSTVIKGLSTALRLSRRKGKKFQIKLGDARIITRALEVTGMLRVLEVVAQSDNRAGAGSPRSER